MSEPADGGPQPFSLMRHHHCAPPLRARDSPAMTTFPPSAPRPSWAKLIFTDIQFWIPVAVLCGGLFVLWWIQ